MVSKTPRVVERKMGLYMSKSSLVVRSLHPPYQAHPQLAFSVCVWQGGGDASK